MRSLIFLIWLTPALAWAADDLQRANELFWEMEYDLAIDLVTVKLKSPDNQPRDLVRAYYIQGLCLSALKKTDEAVLAYRKLLSIDPSFTLDSTISPSLAPPFERARKLSARQAPITLNHRQPEPAKTLAGFKITFSLESDPLELVKAVRLKFRRDERLEVQKMDAHVSGPGISSITLPVSLQALEIRYHLEAINEYGGVLARAGGPDDWYLLKTDAPKVAEKISSPVTVPEKPEVKKKIEPRERQFEIEVHGCLLGNEFVGEQGKGSNPSGPDRINLSETPEIRARMGMDRWGGGLKVGYRLGAYHLIFAQFDYLWEQWIGTITPEGTQDLLRWSANFNLLRTLGGYRFSYPVSEWFSTYAELGLGAHIYLPSTVRLRDKTTGQILHEHEINAGSSFALLLGLGFRFHFLDRFYVGFSYLWDVPVLELSRSSFILATGVSF